MKLLKRCVAIALMMAFLGLGGCDSGDTKSPNGDKDKSKATSGGDTSAQSGFASPDEAFTAFKAAAEKGDVKALMNCMTEQSQKEFAFGMVMMSAFLPMNYMDDEAKATALGKELEDVMGKHGFENEEPDEDAPMEEPNLDEIFAPIEDLVAFTADVYAIIQREDEDPPLNQIKAADVKDIKVDGDTAKGTIVLQEREDEIEFVKKDGGWLILMQEKKPSGEEPGE